MIREFLSPRVLLLFLLLVGLFAVCIELWVQAGDDQRARWRKRFTLHGGAVALALLVTVAILAALTAFN